MTYYNESASSIAQLWAIDFPRRRTIFSCAIAPRLASEAPQRLASEPG
jgi:hypothetical protein